MRSQPVSLLALAMLAGCGSGDVPAHNPNGILLLRGTVTQVSPTRLDIKTDSTVAAIAVVQPFRLYTRAPSSLARVTDSTFIGVTTVEQSDGTDQATEVHIFPPELRGLGEGSYLMAQNAATPSRMTNGSASASRMTNGSASASRSTNGSVTRDGGSSSLVVRYGGRQRTVVVPAATPVTALQVTTDSLAVGSRVVVVAKTASNGTYTASSAILAK